jgi:hypothetical protein
MSTKGRRTSIDFEDLDPDLQESAERLRVSVVEGVEEVSSSPPEKVTMLRSVIEGLEERIEEYEDVV